MSRSLLALVRSNTLNILYSLSCHYGEPILFFKIRKILRKVCVLANFHFLHLLLTSVFAAQSPFARKQSLNTVLCLFIICLKLVTTYTDTRINLYTYIDIALYISSLLLLNRYYGKMNLNLNTPCPIWCGGFRTIKKV